MTMPFEMFCHGGFLLSLEGLSCVLSERLPGQLLLWTIGAGICMEKDGVIPRPSLPG